MGPDAPVPDLRQDSEDNVVVEDGDFEYVADSVRRGRPKKLQTREQLGTVVQLYFVEKLSMREVAKVLGVSHMSIYRMLSDPNVELLL
ncbi:MAG: hypothetical protein ABIJ10_00745 [Candidatus Micrarchaeota archaeon]